MPDRIKKLQILLFGVAVICSLMLATLLLPTAANSKGSTGIASIAKPEETVTYAFTNIYTKDWQEPTFELSSLKQNKGRLVGIFNFKSPTNLFARL